jgi:tetrahydromethanopterin S-methyltransferase subunit E
VALFGGSVTGMGIGILMPFRSIPSLAGIVPAMQKRLSILSLILTAFLGLMTILILVVSNLHK